MLRSCSKYCTQDMQLYEAMLSKLALDSSAAMPALCHRLRMAPQSGSKRFRCSSSTLQAVALGTVLVTLQVGAFLYSKDRSWTSWALAWASEFGSTEIIVFRPQQKIRAASVHSIEMGCTGITHTLSKRAKQWQTLHPDCLTWPISYLQMNSISCFAHELWSPGTGDSQHYSHPREGRGRPEVLLEQT